MGSEENKILILDVKEVSTWEWQLDEENRKVVSEWVTKVGKLRNNSGNSEHFSDLGLMSGCSY